MSAKPISFDPFSQRSTLSFGFLSTYPPTQCGLATFTASLRRELVVAGSRAGVVSLVDRIGPSAPDVVYQLVRGSKASSMRAAQALAGFDAVIVQHEFGIYGGPDGEDVLDVLEELSVPVIVVLHTVLTMPTAHQKSVLEQVVARAGAVVTMAKTSRERLINGYDVDATKVVVIPHGAPEIALRAPELTPRPASTILTWGLIGPGKGIEAVIDVLPELRTLERQPRYRVVGQTHPRVLERDGEAYRTSLMDRAAARGVADLVSFESDYLDNAALDTVVSEADVVVLPYESREQVTSGVLIEAVAAGKPVVATAFPHATELLGDGSGIVVPHDDPQALSAALRRVLSEPGLAASMTGQSNRVSPQLRWSAVAGQYRHLAGKLAASRMAMVA